MAYLVAKTTIEESTGLVTTEVAGHMALHNDKAKAVNSLTDEVIDARTPELATPADTATSIPDLLGQFKQMLKNITGEGDWFDGVVNTLSGLFGDIAALVARFPVVTGDIADDAITSAEIDDNAVLPEHLESGAGTDWDWETWTPTFTNITLAKYTLNYAKFIVIGKTVHFRIKLTMTANTPVTGAISFSLPVDIHGDYTDTDAILASVVYVETGSDSYPGSVRWASSSTFALFSHVASGTFTNLNTLIATQPFTWGNTDEISIAGTYDKA